MNYSTLYNHNTTQAIDEIITRDATGSAGPDTEEVGDKANTRMILPSKTARSISLSQAVSHVLEHDSFENTQVVEDIVQSNPKKAIISSQASKTLPKPFNDTTGYNQAQSHLYKKESSNIYGGVVGEGQLNTVGSWPLHNKSNCKSASIMQSQRDSVFHSDMMGTGENQDMLKNLGESGCSRKEMECEKAKNLSISKGEEKTIIHRKVWAK